MKKSRRKRLGYRIIEETARLVQEDKRILTDDELTELSKKSLEKKKFTESKSLLNERLLLVTSETNNKMRCFPIIDKTII